jgi:NADH-quinone oxidoreductase subunit N
MGVGTQGYTAVSFYLATYLLMTFAAFFVLALIRSEEESDELDAFNGLGKRSPLLAITLTIAMAALAGIPLTAGFWGKFLIFQSAIASSTSWWLLGIAFISVAAGFYYYLKVVRAMYWNVPSNEQAIAIPVITKLALIILTALILILGIYPQPVFNLLGQ